MEKGPSLEEWERIGETRGLFGTRYGIYRSPDKQFIAERDEDDGETAIIFESPASTITYIHPNTVKGAARVGLKLEVGMNYQAQIEGWMKRR